MLQIDGWKCKWNGMEDKDFSCNNVSYSMQIVFHPQMEWITEIVIQTKEHFGEMF